MSKGLEALKKAKKPFDGSYLLNDEQYQVIRNELKALEIIKEETTFAFEERNVITHRKIIKVYQIVINGILTIELSKEEYKLLNEVLL